MNVAIIDIDTTIANNDHRAVLLKRECAECKTPMGGEHRPVCKNCGGEKHNTPQGAWDQFLQADLMLLDDPQPHSLDVINTMREQGWIITFMTGRNEKHRPATREWLSKHGYAKDHDQLIMRPMTDTGKPASQMKEEMFLTYRMQLSTIPDHLRDAVVLGPKPSFFFFEDDRYVLGTWQKYGMVFLCPQAWEFMNPSVLDRAVEPSWNR